MAEFGKFDTVRIQRLLRSNRPYGGISSLSRPPQVGDDGVVVFVYRLATQSPSYLVAGLDAQGRTLWLADFAAEELAPAESLPIDRAA